MTRKTLSVPDEQNPALAFQGMPTALLLRFARGEFDPLEHIRAELASRGVDQEGRWVGHAKARKHWRAGASALLAALLLAGCANSTTRPTETTWCYPPYKSGLVTCKTYR